MERDVGVLVDQRMTMSHLYNAAVKKANLILVIVGIVYSVVIRRY